MQMKMIALLAAATFTFCMPLSAMAAEGTLDAPFNLELSPDGSVVERQARIEKTDSGVFYRFTLKDWTDLSLAFPKTSGRFTITLSRDDRSLINFRQHDPADKPLRLTYGPGKYSLWVQKHWQTESLDYTMQISALATHPRAINRPGDHLASARDIGILKPGSYRQKERTDAGGSDFFYKITVEELTHIAMEIDAGEIPGKLRLYKGPHSIYTPSHKDGPKNLEAVLEPGITYSVSAGIMEGNTDFTLNLTTGPAKAIPADLRAGTDAENAKPLGAVDTKPLRIEGMVRATDNRENWYSFSLDKPAVVDVRRVASDTPNLMVLVIDPKIGLANGVAMPQRAPADTSRFELEAGEHLLRVSPVEFSNRYTLELTTSDDR